MNTDQLFQSIERNASFSFSRSGGPGGQNVNKVNTQVTIRVPIADLGLPGETEARVRALLANRINGTGELILHSSETRSRNRNRERVLARALHLIDSARRPPRSRKATSPGRAAREKRLAGKRVQARRKRDRRRPSPED